MEKITPEEEQRIETAIFRMKNRLIYRPFFIVAVLSVGLGALFYWRFVPLMDQMSGEGAAMTLMSPILLPVFAMWLFVTPRYSLLKFPAWKDKPGYERTWSGWVGLSCFVLPVMIPNVLLYRYFEQDSGRLLMWAIGTFIVGLIAFLAFIHTYPFDARKLKKFALDKRIDIKQLRLK